LNEAPDDRIAALDYLTEIVFRSRPNLDAHIVPLGLWRRPWQRRCLRSLITRLDGLGLERIGRIAALLCELHQPLNSVLSVSACSRDAGDDGGDAINSAVPHCCAIIKLESVRVSMTLCNGFARLNPDNNWGNENSLTSRDLFQDTALFLFFETLKGLFIIR
jgi:hypothetical protein